MELRHLRYFMAIAREGSLTKASEYLHVTQPTLSRQMQDLEEDLGVDLFIRRSHRLELTDEGVRLRERAREILVLVDKTEDEFRCEQEGVSGDVYIGATETILVEYIALIAKEIREHHPGIRFQIHSGNEETISERLDSGMLDFGMLMEPADISKYHNLTLPETDVWGVLMRADSPLAEKDAITADDLAGLPIFASRQALGKSHTQNIFSSWLGDKADMLDIVGTFDLITNASAFVREGLGYVFTVEGLMGLNADNALCFRPMLPELRPRSSIVWKQDRSFSPAAQVFFDEMMRQWAGR